MCLKLEEEFCSVAKTSKHTNPRLEGQGMSESVDAIKDFIDRCSKDEQRALFEYIRKKIPRHPLEQQWDIDGETILTAIYRSPDLTQRGVRGILAEAVFERDIIPTVEKLGWRALPLPAGEPPFDFLLEKRGKRASIQVKLQRTQQGKPKRFSPRRYVRELYVVEVQKTRSGKKRQEGAADASVKGDESTRPYRLGDFDILAVNMQPATRKWNDFRYTLGSWLTLRKSNPHLIEIFQPVSLQPNNLWTDKLDVCLEWFRLGNRRNMLRWLRGQDALSKP